MAKIAIFSALLVSLSSFSRALPMMVGGEDLLPVTFSRVRHPRMPPRPVATNIDLPHYAEIIDALFTIIPADRQEELKRSAIPRAVTMNGTFLSSFGEHRSCYVEFWFLAQAKVDIALKEGEAPAVLPAPSNEFLTESIPDYVARIDPHYFALPNTLQYSQKVPIGEASYPQMRILDFRSGERLPGRYTAYETTIGNTERRYCEFDDNQTPVVH